MGNTPSFTNNNFNTINYEQVQNGNYMLITTLSEFECHIKNTLTPSNEVEHINFCISKNKQENIIIYGKHYLDNSIYLQYKKLKSLGFDNIYIYPGGIFEWLLLQEVYGLELFPTNKIEKDILKYKPK